MKSLDVCGASVMVFHPVSPVVINFEWASHALLKVSLKPVDGLPEDSFDYERSPDDTKEDLYQALDAEFTERHLTLREEDLRKVVEFLSS